MILKGFSVLRLLTLAAGLVLATGCSQESQSTHPSGSMAMQTDTPPERLMESAASTASAANMESKANTEEEHPHIPGAHGGIIVPIGADSYHAEAVVEKSGNFRLLTLGKDESRIQEVDIQPIKAYVKAAGDPDTVPMDLTATPQDGDSSGKTSPFVGQLPESLIGKPLDVTIPNLRIAGERFRVGFTTASVEHDAGMPSGVSADEERELYLMPSGKYTLADINANGNVTASQKFKGVLSSHNMNPKKGDRICPVTMTKANPKFTWVIDGKPYEFCCPPCVDEFVRIAKEEPAQLKSPDEFIKR